MNLAKIVVGIVFLVAVTVVYGDVHNKQRCAYFLPEWTTWEANAPEDCKPWDGCSTADQGGRCTGVFNAEIGDVTIAYPVMSCKVESRDTVYKCKDFASTKCVDDDKGVCLRYRVYYSTNCTNVTESAEQNRSGYKCYTDRSSGG